MVSLSGLELVYVQFRCTNEKAIPPSLPVMEESNKEERERLNRKESGRLVIKPADDCAIKDLPEILSDSGYELVDAVCQQRDIYYVVRFVFLPKGIADPDRERFDEELEAMCTSSFWRGCVYLNPYYRNGGEVLGANTLSINLTARKPCLQKDGTPVLVWEKNENGERTGDAPVPITPKHCFVNADGNLAVL